MRYFLIFAALLWAALTQADTHAQRLAELQGATGVLDAWLAVPFAPIAGSDVLSKGTYRYALASGDTVTDNSVGVVAVDFGGQDEAVYWLNGIPEPLRVVPVQKYITDRTGGGFTLAQVTASVQAIWAQANPATEAIKGLTVEAVDGATIRVRGSFDKGDGSNETRTYLMWLVDVNGSTTLGNANIKWRRETAG